MKKQSRKYLLLFALWVCLIFVLTSIPKAGGISPFPHFDKVAHFSVYFVAGFLFSRYLREEGKNRESILIITIFVISLVGGIDEIHQRWISGRVCSIYDWIADMAGGAGGAFVVVASHRLRELFPSPKNE
ncbi:MAG: hypothetical protein D6713_05885 [Deltaproteobacteria bacterium]|nr:MAG: hypothetical protein D6713_05885 [Deltaproteobacteria bacterium]